MTKQELIRKIKTETGIDERTVSLVLESALSQIQESLGNRESVFLRGFGTFEAKLRAEKKARNISEKTVLTIPAHYVPHFKPSADFKKKLENS